MNNSTASNSVNFVNASNESFPEIDSKETKKSTTPEIKEEKSEPTSQEERRNITSGSINLIPTMSKEEVQVVEKKGKVNVSGAAFVVLFALITIGILGVNIIYKQRLNNAKARLNELTKEYNGNASVIKSNDEILDRIYLFKSIQESTYSPKSVLEYWRDTIAQFGSVSDVRITNELEFSIQGEASTLNEVAQLWHLLSTDPRIDEISLKSVATPSSSSGKVGNVAQFSFEGKLNYDYFLANPTTTE
ncbi:MAG: hypothetical protein Fur003_6430 [Candidatus Dojkabacteria bacterium]